MRKSARLRAPKCTKSQAFAECFFGLRVERFVRFFCPPRKTPSSLKSFSLPLSTWPFITFLSVDLPSETPSSFNLSKPLRGDLTPRSTSPPRPPSPTSRLRRSWRGGSRKELLAPPSPRSIAKQCGAGEGAWGVRSARSLGRCAFRDETNAPPPNTPLLKRFSNRNRRDHRIPPGVSKTGDVETDFRFVTFANLLRTRNAISNIEAQRPHGRRVSQTKPSR